MSAKPHSHWTFDHDGLKPLDLSTYLSRQPKKYEPTEASIAERAKEVLAYWKLNPNRYYDRFSYAMDRATSNDDLICALFDSWRDRHTADLGLTLAEAIDSELYGLADKYARDEQNGTLGSRDERIP